MSLALLPFVLALASVPDQSFDALRTFRCDFTESGGRRTSAAGITSPATRETFADLVVDAIDRRARTARFVGNAGSETVQAIDGVLVLTFVEVTQSGNVAVMTIFKQPASLDLFDATYSRHVAFSTGERVASQSYGTCRGLR